MIIHVGIRQYVQGGENTVYRHATIRKTQVLRKDIAFLTRVCYTF